MASHKLQESKGQIFNIGNVDDVEKRELSEIRDRLRTVELEVREVKEMVTKINDNLIALLILQGENSVQQDTKLKDVANVPQVEGDKEEHIYRAHATALDMQLHVDAPEKSIQPPTGNSFQFGKFLQLLREGKLGN